MAWWPDNLTDWIVVISGIATAILVIIVGRQLSITKKEIESRLRPWVLPVSITPTFVTLKNGDTWDFDEIMLEMRKDHVQQIDVIHYEILFINSGTIPTKTSYALLGQKEKFTRNAFNDKPMDHTLTMAPNHNYNDHVKVPDKELRNGQKYYAGISLEYILNNKKIKSGAIYEITGNNRDLSEDWHDEDC